MYSIDYHMYNMQANAVIYWAQLRMKFIYYLEIDSYFIPFTPPPGNLKITLKCEIQILLTE